MIAARADFLGVGIDVLTMEETLARVRDSMRNRKPLHHVAMNVAKFVKMRGDSELRADVECSDVVGIDGMGIVFAARLLGIPVRERVAGVDLMQAVIAVCVREGYKPYFLGASEPVLQKALANVRNRFPSIQIAGAQHGYYPADDEQRVVAAIRDSGADCLFIAMPTPRKERFLARYRDELGASFVMGVGGSVDVLAGYVKRAPSWMQSIGCEWLFRTVQEPGRMWKRYLTTNFEFACIVAMAMVDPRRLSRS